MFELHFPSPRHVLPEDDAEALLQLYERSEDAGSLEWLLDSLGD